MVSVASIASCVDISGNASRKINLLSSCTLRCY